MKDKLKKINIRKGEPVENRDFIAPVSITLTQSWQDMRKRLMERSK